VVLFDHLFIILVALVAICFRGLEAMGFAKERFEMLLEQSPTLFQRVSKSQLAAYLGVSRETLSRLHK
jgi:CRP-like cAMP-binding protein